jgi:hypothetical protein
MEIIHFVIDNLSIKITLIISLFVILKHSINLPALTLESHGITVVTLESNVNMGNIFDAVILSERNKQSKNRQ